MKNDILSRLQTKCSFPEVFEEKEKVEGCSFTEPLRKIGHIRADYDGYRWYNTVWPCHRELATPEACNYWVRLITRRGDYNLYLNAYTRGEVHESISDH